MALPSLSAAAMLFEDVPAGPLDPMHELKVTLDADRHPNKCDLGAGVYRDEQAQCYEFPVIKKAKTILSTINPGHDYGPTTGLPTFVSRARALVFGENCARLQESKIASCQAISGTGACHLAAVFLSQFYRPGGHAAIVHVGLPAWGNYLPLFKRAGLETKTYPYYNDETKSVDFGAVLQAVQEAPQGSIFVLQACCHNPTGADLSRDQWIELAAAIQNRNHFPFFDLAYQGFASGDQARDAWPVRYFESQGMALVVCQSFSKNLGLYAERVGALHVAVGSHAIAANVTDQLRTLVRAEFSTSPAFGARLVDIVLGLPALEQEWYRQLASAVQRLQSTRKSLHKLLAQDLKTPGDWRFLLTDQGLFSTLPLTPGQVQQLIRERHIYATLNGRINIAGLNAANIRPVAEAIDALLRSPERA